MNMFSIYPNDFAFHFRNATFSTKQLKIIRTNHQLFCSVAHKIGILNCKGVSIISLVTIRAIESWAGLNNRLNQVIEVLFDMNDE